MLVNTMVANKMPNDIQYPDEFTNRLQTLWGDGFLSPGGDEEVNEIITDLDLRHKVVLDIGFGMGGPAISLVKNHHVGKVIGIDVEQQLLANARTNAENAGVSERIDFKIVEPGELQFEDETFDIVFSKDSLVHIKEKSELFHDIYRVLKPDGVIAVSDWLCGSDNESKSALEKFRELAHLRFTMASSQKMENSLRESGFINVTSRDRNAWFSALVDEEIRQIEGRLYQQLVDCSGKETITHWLDIKRAQLLAAQSGGLRPTHLRGYKHDQCQV